MENSRIKSNLGLYRLIFILVSVMVVLSFCSCRSSRITERIVTKTDTIYKAVNVTNNKYTAHEDTIHDSIYVREVVNEKGETKYKERVVYRDRKGNTIVKMNTIHDTIQVAKHDLSQSVTDKKVYKPPLYKTIIASAVFLALVILIAYAVKHNKP